MHSAKAGKTLELCSEHNEWEGKVSARVAWVNAPGGGTIKIAKPMDEAQKRQLLDEGYLLELAKLNKAREDAEMVSAGAQNETNRVRHALGSLLEDPEVPSEVKQYVRVVLGRVGYTY